MKKIETGLHEVHALAKQSRDKQQDEQMDIGTGNIYIIITILHHLLFCINDFCITKLAVTVFTDNIRRSFDQEKMTGAVFINLQKAFGCFRHSILPKRLPYYGILGAELKWMKSYLKERRQFVVYDGESYEISEVDYGMPQGSTLGPLLFLLYINELVKAVERYQVLM